ncbi:MAG: hypothetical protein KBC95_05245 [Candidatus Peribacteraceae bacterium]|nr:hypothetical protein [Candidatus Peribacteraceae bacterium]
MDSQLSHFIAAARQKGMDFQSIKSLLVASGWKERDVEQALVSQTLDMAVPTPPDVGGAREAFLHLLSFACLYIGLGSLIFLYFNCLEWLFPDPAFDYNTYVDNDWSGLRWQMAMVIVTFPIFIWISKIIANDIRQHPEKNRSGLRRWLTYLTLFLTALVLIGDGVTLVWYMLEGELTIRFILKVLIVLALAGDTFLYYLGSLRPGANDRQIAGMRRGRWLELKAWIFVLVAIVWGFALVGNPLTQRERRLDEQRVSDLQSIVNELSTQVRGPQRDATTAPTLLKPVPATLQAIVDAAVYTRPRIVDPETNEPYGYTVKDADTVELCADFAEARDREYDISWDHPAGRHCYTIDLLGLNYPNPTKPIAI